VKTAGLKTPAAREAALEQPNDPGAPAARAQKKRPRPAIGPTEQRQAHGELVFAKLDGRDLHLFRDVAQGPQPDLAVSDLGPTQLKNIAEPVRLYSLEVGKPAQAKPAPTPAPEKSSPPRLSMVVLPFANIGGDPEQEHFVDGVTESLTTDLSRIRAVVVIARNTAFVYKRKPLHVKTIGRELNVPYVLEGSVQRGGNRMRVNGQLIDAETGNHLWAERFDKPLADLFDMQHEIVSRMANVLNTELVAAEARRAEQTPTPDSIDLYFQGMAWLNKGLTPDHVAQARSFFDRALAADPDNVDALSRRPQQERQDTGAAVRHA
jgi:TolB-like protein